MSKPANKTLIGMFVVGAIALAVVAVVVLGSGKFFKETIKYVMFFEGSVKGLSVGAPVILRGVKVGSVSEIKLTIDPKDLSVLIPIYVEFGGEGEVQGLGEKKGIVEALLKRGKQARLEGIRQLIDRGLRAQLDMQSFVTGQLQVALDFHPDKPAKIVGADPETPEIPTVPTALQELLKKIENIPLDQIVKDAQSTMQSISQAADEARQLVHNVNVKVGPVLSDVQGAVGDARHLMQNVDGKIGPIASSVADTAKEIQTLARSANEQVQPLSASAQETLKEAQKLLRGLDEKTTTLTARIDEVLKDAQHLVRNVDGEIGPVAVSLKSTLASIEKAAGEAEVTLRQAQQTLKSVEGDLGEDSELMYEFNQVLRDVRGLAKAIRDLADTLDRQPESAIFGKKHQTGR